MPFQCGCGSDFQTPIQLRNHQTTTGHTKHQQPQKAHGELAGAAGVAPQIPHQTPAASPPCAFCGSLGATKVCSACKKVYYCCRQCQQKHWKKHKIGCAGSGSKELVSAGRDAVPVALQGQIAALQQQQQVNSAAGDDRLQRLIASAQGTSSHSIGVRCPLLLSSGNPQAASVLERVQHGEEGRVWQLEQLPKWLWSQCDRPVARRSARELSCADFEVYSMRLPNSLTGVIAA